MKNEVEHSGQPTVREIWLLLDSRAPGGVESHILQLAEGLHQHGMSVRVVFLTNYGPHPLQQALYRKNIPVTVLDGKITTLCQTLRDKTPTVVHTHGYKAGILGRLAARICRIPVVTTFHAGEIPSGRLKMYDWLDRHTAWLANRVFAVSSEIAERLPVRAHVTDNFVSTTHLTCSRGEQIAFVGRLSDEKGADRFLHLARHFPTLDFHIYGDGPQAAELKHQAPDNLHFHGLQEDMSVIWPKIGLLVMPSRHEGMPMAALEAMAREIPVLASQVGALDRLIEGDVNGWLVPSDDFANFAQYLQQWLSMSDEKRESFRKAARDKIQRQFSSETVIPQLINDYRQISTPSGNELNQPRGVLFVHYGDEWIRGSERCLLDLLTHLDRERFTPVLWCNSHALADEAKKLGIAVYRSDFSLLFGWKCPRFDIKGFGRLVHKGRELVANHRIKLIHANSGAPNQWLNIVARAEGVPLLAHLHARYPLRDRFTLGLHHVTMAVGVSPPVAEHLLQDGMNPERVCVIANGIDTVRQERTPAVDLRALLNMKSQDYLIMTVGSLIHRKGIDLIIDAVHQLISKEIPAHLAIIGDGPERTQLEEKAYHLGISHFVHFLGERPDVFALLRGGVDLFVSGAREEVFGLVLAEASLAGLAVVAPRVGGIPGVVVADKTGVLVTPEDANALARAMEDLYFTPRQREVMGIAGREHVLNHFTIQRNVQQFEQLYQQLHDSPTAVMHWYSHWQFRYPLINGIKQLATIVKNRFSRSITQ